MSQTNIFLVLISTILVNNFVLVQFLGLCPFMGVSNKVESALGMALATTFVMTLSSVLSHLTYSYILLPFDLQYLRTLAFILVIAATVQLTEMIIHKTNPLLHRVLGLFLPLIATNCAILGVVLLNSRKEGSTLFDSALHGFGAAAGFSLVLLLFSTMRERIAVIDVPKPFQGSSITLITAGLVSLAFLGFSGLVKL